MTGPAANQLLPNDNSNPASHYNDIAMRDDGELFTSGTIVNAGGVAYITLDTGNRARLARRGRESTSVSNVQRGREPNGLARTSGITFQALAEVDTVTHSATTHCVSSGPSAAPTAAQRHRPIQNMLFLLNANGAAIQYPDDTLVR